MTHEFESLLDRLNALAERHHALVLENHALNHALREEEAARITTLAEISHELRRPFAIIRLLLEQLEKKECQKHAPVFLTINTEIDRAGKLLDDIITLNKLELKKIGPAEDFSLSELCTQILENCRARFPAHRFRALITPEIFFHAAKENILVILENLLENAAKYAPKNKTITLHLTREKDFCELAVEDEGRSIPLAECRKILTPYYRRKKSAHANAGSGLGLAIVHEAVRNLAGELKIEPGKKGGNIFRVRLPILIHP